MSKCVIIGSGLGGLTCGVIMAKNGYEVTVLEQGRQIGGCLQCFHRGGVTFDTGMHYIGSADVGQVLQIYLNYLGVYTDIQLSKLDPMGYDIIAFKGQHYNIANGKENFVNELAKKFPHSREELQRYYDLVKTVSSSMAMHALNGQVDINVSTLYQTRSVNEVIDELIGDPTLREVLAGMQPLYAGRKDKTPFATHALIHDCFEQSAYRIVGGSASLANALIRQIELHGGRIIVRQKAKRIECNNTCAVAVTTTTGERYEADMFISAIHPARTLELLDTPLIKSLYRKRITGYENSTGAFVVYLKFKKNSLKYINHNLYLYRGDTVWGCETYDVTTWPKFLLYMHFCHQENPEYAETGKILTYMNFDEVAKWAGSKVQHRGEEYELFKRRKAELLIDALEEEVPDIRYHIEDYYTSTPLTYLDYTDIPNGAMYGISKDVRSTGVNGVSCRTGIPNLLLSGQSVTSHGMFGVVAGSFITCSEMLSRAYIYSQLKS